MNPSSSIRLAQRADIPGLPAIERAASTLFPEGRIPDVDDAMPVAELERAADHGLLLVAASQERVVGFAMAVEAEGFLHLAVMAVHPEFGNRGFGRALLTGLIQEASRRKALGVTLTTFDDLPWNGPFYRKAGFRNLSDGDLSPSLRAILDHEASLGMVNRVAMRYTIAASIREAAQEGKNAVVSGP